MSDAPAGNDYRGLALISTAVAEMVAPTLLGAWLDSRNGWTPWGVLAGATLGLSVSVFHLLRIGRKS